MKRPVEDTDLSIFDDLTLVERQNSKKRCTAKVSYIDNKYFCKQKFQVPPTHLTSSVLVFELECTVMLCVRPAALSVIKATVSSPSNNLFF